MPSDPYAVLRALLRAEAQRSAPKPPSRPDRRERQQPPRDRERG